MALYIPPKWGISSITTWSQLSKPGSSTNIGLHKGMCAITVDVIIGLFEDDEGNVVIVADEVKTA